MITAEIVMNILLLMTLFLMIVGPITIVIGIIYLIVKDSKKIKKERKINWTLTLLMSIFFGNLGIDRFIMGYVGLGLLKMLTFGGLGVWWLIDVILIATKYKFKKIIWQD